MKPVYQTKQHNPPSENGNCFRACVASILEIDIDVIPHFEDMDGDVWFKALTDWANTLNYIVYCQSFYRNSNHSDQTRISLKNLMDLVEIGKLSKNYCVITGKSPRGDWDHCVVGLNGCVVFDPWPFSVKPNKEEDLEDVLDCIFILKPHFNEIEVEAGEDIREGAMVKIIDGKGYHAN